MEAEGRITADERTALIGLVSSIAELSRTFLGLLDRVVTSLSENEKAEIEAIKAKMANDQEMLKKLIKEIGNDAAMRLRCGKSFTLHKMLIWRGFGR